MKFIWKIKKIEKNEYTKDGKKNLMYTLCVIEDNFEKQYPEGVAVNFFSDRWHEEIIQQDLKVGEVVKVAFSISYRETTKEYKEEDGTITKKTYISNSLNGFRIERVQEQKTTQTPSVDENGDELPF